MASSSTAVVMPPSPRYVPPSDDSYSDDDDFEVEAKAIQLNSDVVHDATNIDTSTPHGIVSDAADEDSFPSTKNSTHDGKPDAPGSIVSDHSANADVGKNIVGTVDDISANMTVFDDDSSGDDVPFRCERERVVFDAQVAEARQSVVSYMRAHGGDVPPTPRDGRTLRGRNRAIARALKREAAAGGTQHYAEQEAARKARQRKRNGLFSLHADATVVGEDADDDLEIHARVLDYGNDESGSDLVSESGSDSESKGKGGAANSEPVGQRARDKDDSAGSSTPLRSEALRAAHAPRPSAAVWLILDALRRGECPTHGGELSLSNSGLGDDEALMVAAGLASERSTTYTAHLRGNMIGKRGAAAIGKALATNMSTRLLSLSMGGNLLGDSGVRALARALAPNSTLTELSLVGSNPGRDGFGVARAVGRREFGERGARALGVLLRRCMRCSAVDTAATNNAPQQQYNRGCRHCESCGGGATALLRLKLSLNHIGDAGAHALAQALGGMDAGLVSQQLRSFDGDWDTLTNDESRATLRNAHSSSHVAGGPSHIAKNLPVPNTTLRVLEIDQNGIGDSGALSLAMVLAHVSDTNRKSVNTDTADTKALCTTPRKEGLQVTEGAGDLTDEMLLPPAPQPPALLPPNEAEAETEAALVAANDAWAGDVLAQRLDILAAHRERVLVRDGMSKSMAHRPGLATAASASVTAMVHTNQSTRHRQPALRVLNLSQNNITDRGARAIAVGLSMNASLNELLLDGNAIGPPSLEPLLEAVQRRAASHDSPTPTAISLFDNSGFGPQPRRRGSFFDGDVAEMARKKAEEEAEAMMQLKRFDDACAKASGQAVAARSLLNARRRRCDEEQAARAQVARDHVIEQRAAQENLQRAEKLRAHKEAQLQQFLLGGAAEQEKKERAKKEAQRRLRAAMGETDDRMKIASFSAGEAANSAVDPGVKDDLGSVTHDDEHYRVGLRQLLAFYAEYDPGKSRAEVKHVLASWPRRDLVEGLLEKYGDDPRRFGNDSRARRFQALYTNAGGGMKLPMIETVAANMSKRLEPVAAAASRAARGRAPQHCAQIG